MTDRIIKWQLYIDWDFDGSYTLESDRLLSANGQNRFHPPAENITAGKGIVDQATLTLANYDGRYSPLNTGSAIYSAISGGGAYHCPLYLNVSIDDGANYYRVFTGVAKIPQEVTPTSKEAGTITLDCRSRDEAVLQKRVTTTHTIFVQIHDEGWNEEQVIARWLQDAGMTDGTDFVSQAYHAANPGTPATLDAGLFALDWAWLDDESAIEDCWAIAAACGGRFYCDVEGKFRYENAQHWLYSPHTTSQATYDKNDFSRLVPGYNDRELFSDISVEVTRRDILESDVLWEPDAPLVIPPNTTQTVVAKLQQPAYSIDGITYTAVTSGGQNITGDVTVTPTAYAQRVSLSITNVHATKAAQFAILQIIGRTVDGRPAAEETASSSDTFWDDREGRTRSVSGNLYIQSQAQAAFLAEFLRDRMEVPRLFYTLENTPGDPQRRLGDRITVNDPDVMSAGREVMVLAIPTWTLSPQGFRQNFYACDAAALYPESHYFTIGTDSLGNPSEPLFY